MGFQLVIFDWDGTLSDSNACLADCARAACVDTGMVPPATGELSAVLGLDIMEATQRLYPDEPRARREDFIRRFWHHHAQRSAHPSLFPGTAEMLRTLRSRGLFLALATSLPRAALESALGRTDLSGTFHGSRSAEETASKPNPQMLFELMHELGTPPDRTLMVGDTVHDLRMAANAGMASAGICHSPVNGRALLALGPLNVAVGAEELHRWLLDHACPALRDPSPLTPAKNSPSVPP